MPFAFFAQHAPEPSDPQATETLPDATLKLSRRRRRAEAMEELLPWIVSFLAHTGLVIIAAFIVWSIRHEPDDDTVIMPSATLSDKPGGNLSESREVRVDDVQMARSVESETIVTDESLDNITADATGSVELVGLSVGTGSKLAPYGSGGKGTGLGAGFFGTGGNANKIIFLVDASGSLIDTFPFVLKELKRSVSNLVEQQEYTIIFFQDGEPIEVDPIGWKPANDENKRRTFEFISLDARRVVPRGRTDPLKAIKLAMKYKPQLVFMLSDNITGKDKYEVNREDLLRSFREADPEGKITINTIQFVYPDPLNTLQAIAAEHRGEYRFVREDDLR